MKFWKKFFVTVCCLLTGALVLSACGETEQPPTPPRPTPPVAKTEMEIEFTDLSGEYDANIFYDNVYKDGPQMGDPFVYYEDGTFYLYGTTRKRPDGTVTEEFLYYTSPDMVNWTLGTKNEGVCFGLKSGEWQKERLWAPELHKIGDLYWFYYTAAPDGRDESIRSSVAVAASPEGPFTNDIHSVVPEAPANLGSKPIFDFGYKLIDGTIFEDDDGSLYYYYAKDQVDVGAPYGRCSTIYGIEMENPYTVKEGAKPKQLTEVGYSKVGMTGAYDRKWEVYDNSRKWNEGPYMVKHDGTYYMTYSANYFGDTTYSVGYATCTTPLGDFEKPEDNQVLGVQNQKSNKWDYFSGSGHHMFLEAEGQNYIVYHRHTDPKAPGARYMTFDTYGFRPDGSLYTNGPTITAQPLPEIASGYKNVAYKAKITAVDGKGTGYLADGAIACYEEYAGREFVGAEGAEITLEFPTDISIKAILFYNGAKWENRLENVANVTMENATNVYTFDNVKMDANAMDATRKQLFVGGAASAVFGQTYRVNKITVTLDAAANISEIVVLAA